MPRKDPIARAAYQAERHERRKQENGYTEERDARVNKYLGTPKGRAKQSNAAKRMRQVHPEKDKARQVLRSAVRRGKVRKLPCQVCGDIKSQGHHPDYSKPLEVEWFCQTHHPS